MPLWQTTYSQKMISCVSQVWNKSYLPAPSLFLSPCSASISIKRQANPPPPFSIVRLISRDNRRVTNVLLLSSHLPIFKVNVWGMGILLPFVIGMMTEAQWTWWRERTCWVANVKNNNSLFRNLLFSVGGGVRIYLWLHLWVVSKDTWC